MTKKKTGRGGFRPGAGRKPDGDEPRVTMGLRVYPQVKEYLDSTGNASREVERMVLSRLKRQKRKRKK